VASLTEVISDEVIDTLVQRLKIDLISEGYSSFDGGTQFTVTARLRLDDTVISESTTDLYLTNGT
jgi:hypothetical protein